MAGRAGEEKWFSWAILDNGAPVRFEYVENVLVSATDESGQPIADPKYALDRIRGRTLGMNVASSYLGDSHGWEPRRYASAYRESSAYLYALTSYSHPRFEQWFYLRKKHLFIGMLPAEKKAFATLGQGGFGPADLGLPGYPEEVQFDHLGDILALNSHGSLNFANLPRRELTRITASVPAPIYGMGHSWASTGNRNVHFLGVAFGTAMAVYHANASSAATLPYQHDVERWGQISMGVLPSLDRFVLQSEPSAWIDRATRKTMPAYVDTFDAKGNVLASATLPPLPEPVRAVQRSGWIAQRLGSPAFYFGQMLYRRIGAAFGSERLRDALDGQLVRNRKATVEIGIALVVVALILAAVTFVWARRAQLPPRNVRAWTAAVFAFGLPGFLVFWLAGERPPLVPCPACHHLRRIDREQCGKCSAPWPGNAANGSEIFEHAAR